MAQTQIHDHILDKFQHVLSVPMASLWWGFYSPTEPAQQLHNEQSCSVVQGAGTGADTWQQELPHTVKL